MRRASGAAPGRSTQRGRGGPSSSASEVHHPLLLLIELVPSTCLRHLSVLCSLEGPLGLRDLPKETQCADHVFPRVCQLSSPKFPEQPPSSVKSSPMQSSLAGLDDRPAMILSTLPLNPKRPLGLIRT